MDLKEAIKSHVRYDSPLKKVLVYLYHASKYRPWKPRKLKSPDFSELIDAYSRAKNRVRFLQIGSNDGMESDPLRKFILRDRWTGILVEPLPTTFSRLLKNYENYSYKYDLTFENVAVSDKHGVLTFYYIDHEHAGVPEGKANKFSSFNREIPLKLKWVYPAVAENIMEMPITTLTLAELLEKNNLTGRIDVLHVDTEGHDYVILKQLDLKQTRPDIVLFENLHLKMGDYKNCVDRFRKFDYVLFEQHLDTIAIQRQWKEKLVPDH